jgi:hypothetical protein
MIFTATGKQLDPYKEYACISTTPENELPDIQSLLDQGYVVERDLSDIKPCYSCGKILVVLSKPIK